jgi:hypothetical protein
MTVPGTLRAGGWPGYVGPVSFYRRFGRPSNLGTGDRVRLAFAGVKGRAEVLLNGERVGEVADLNKLLSRDHARTTLLMTVARGAWEYTLTFPLN